MQRRLWKQILVINIIFCVESTSIFRCGAHKDNSLTHKAHRHPFDIICVQSETREEGKKLLNVLHSWWEPPHFLPRHILRQCRRVLICLYWNKSKWSAEYSAWLPMLFQMYCKVIHDLCWIFVIRLHPGSVFMTLNVCILNVYIILKVQKAFYAPITIINLIHR